VKDVYEVLGQKEVDCARLRIEIEALRLVIPLLDDEHPTPEPEDQEQRTSSLFASENNNTDDAEVPPLDYTKSTLWGRRWGNKH
jgi:hypothetical protein